MISQAIYRTNFGEVVAAAAEERSSVEKSRVDQAGVQVVHTAGGLELLIGVVASSLDGELGPSQTSPTVEQVIQYCQGSQQHDIPTMLRQAIAASIPDGQGGGTIPKPTEMVMAIQGRRLYLAQLGDSHAYLVREGQLVRLTREHTVVGDLMHLEKTVPPHVPFRIGKTEQNRVMETVQTDDADTTIHMPGTDGKPFIDLVPGDGVLLSTDGLVEPIVSTGRNNHLKEDFISLYETHSPSVIADRLMQAANTSQTSNRHSLIVLKSDQSSIPVATGGLLGNSCLGQIGVIALILIVSIALGLGAAIAVPAMVNPKPLPVTAANQTPKFISILSADGLVQATLPGQPADNLAAGGTLNAVPGTVLTSTRGTSKLQMLDGTNLYIDNNTNALLEKLADPKANILSSVIILNKGAVIVDSSHANNTTTTVQDPNPVQSSVVGSYVGVEYVPDQKVFTVTCMEGPCQVSGASQKKTLNSGEMVSLMDGKFGTIIPADWSRWTSLCDTDCPIQPPATLPTPTIVPTPVPYLGSILVDPTADPTAILLFFADPIIPVTGQQAAHSDPTATSLPPSPTATTTTVIASSNPPPQPKPTQPPNPNSGKKQKPPKPPHGKGKGGG